MPNVVLREWEVVVDVPTLQYSAYGFSALRLTLDLRAQRGGALEAGQRLGFALLQRYIERIKTISRI